MKPSSDCRRAARSTSVLLGGFVLLLGIVSTGCQQRQLAPEIEYSDAKVQQIRDEIDEMEWE